MKTVLITMSAAVLLTLAAGFLYRCFVGSWMVDGGRTENPDAYRPGRELVEFSWRQSRTDDCGCFTLHFYLENDLPVLTGRFRSREGEARESGMDAPIPWQLTWVQWFALQNMLAESALPEYRQPSSGGSDALDSEICVVWRTEDGEISEKHSGRNADELETLALRIAEEAYAASQSED